MFVTPIYNKGDILDPDNYRAISLLLIHGKVFSRTLLKGMKARTEVSIIESFWLQAKTKNRRRHFYSEL